MITYIKKKAGIILSSGLRKKRVLCICGLLTCQLLQGVYFRHLGMNEGLSQVSVLTILQDQLGRMWFGTREGISLYDGERMLNFKEWNKEQRDVRINTLLGDECNYLVENTQGDIFFKAAKSMLRYDIETELFHEIAAQVNHITSYDKKIWVSSGNKIYTYDEAGDSLALYLEPQIKEDIQCLHVSANTLWAGTFHGLYAIDKDKHDTRCIIEDIQVFSLFESSQNELWIGTHSKGLIRWNPDGTMRQYAEELSGENHLVSNRIREFAEDKYGDIWFGTFLGLYRHDREADTLQVYQHDYLPGSMSHSSVFAVYFDRQETLWIGTYYGGVNYFNPEKKVFDHYDESPYRNDCLNHPFVGHMAEDREGFIWICTEGGGLNKLDRKRNVFTYYIAGEDNALLQNNLKAIAYDEKRHQLYIGTHFGGLSRYDITRGVFHNYLKDYTGSLSMPYQIVKHIELYNDKVYACSTNGVFTLDPDKDVFEYICQNTEKFHIDSEGYIWITTDTTLSRINLSNTSERKDFPLTDQQIFFKINHFSEDDRGNLFFVTLGSGLFRYDKETETFIRYSSSDGFLLSDYCYNISKIYTGELLITSDKGITFLDPLTLKSEHYKLRDHLPISAITEGCGLLACKDGELFVGGSDGMTSFKRENLRTKRKDYSLYFSDLYINNSRVSPGGNDGILGKAIPYLSSIRLKHDQNNLKLQFASSNYIDIQKNLEYEYRLVGFDKEWITTPVTSIQYMNLSPGKYTLQVREKESSDNAASPKEIIFDIFIVHPWYNTVWARLFYVIFTTALIYFIIRQINSRRELSLSLLQERKEKEQIEKLNQVKLSFFTSISHEFRTPLTLIISQIDSLNQNMNLSPRMSNKISGIRKNAYQMKTMIGELLEFRKLEQNYIALQVAEQNLIPFLEDIYLSCRELANQKMITFTFHSNCKEGILWFDATQLQKVIYNLLTNAFKYTQRGGSVEIFAEETESDMYIKIIDNGIGLSEKDAARVFERFYQVENKFKLTDDNPGTGIGLALSKTIVNLHHGELFVQSEINYGSIFTVQLRKGKKHFERDEKCIIREGVESVDREVISNSKLIPENPVSIEDGMPGREEQKKPYTVLLVEDNEELLQILNDLFAPIYNVILAHNGKEGIECAAEYRPDLIVCDIMMPGMDGIEMCSKIKNNKMLCHIPIVLLTALETVEHKLKGLQQGADDYISKPFHAKLLLTRCNNLIKNRLLIKNQQNSQLDLSGEKLASTSADQQLMNRITEIIEKHINNPDFDINAFASELGMGRSTLFTKMKQLIGMAPNEYIQSQRLKRAAAVLLEQPDLQITEIAEQFGFVSVAYFSRCFKAQFGESPLHFRKKEIPDIEDV